MEFIYVLLTQRKDRQGQYHYRIQATHETDNERLGEQLDEIVERFKDDRRNTRQFDEIEEQIRK